LDIGPFSRQKVSVLASGMGHAFHRDYSYELYHFYGVEAILEPAPPALSPGVSCDSRAGQGPARIEF
jgi:hypothetical protein